MKWSIEELSQPVSEESPSGPNLEYDVKFQEMDRLSRHTPAPMDRADKEGTPADWKGVEKISGTLRTLTRDLRVQVLASIASIHTSGIPEFRDNLNLLKIYLADFWDSVHPQLDPDDDNDPTLRLNALQMLNSTSYAGLPLGQCKLVQLKGIGQFGLRDIDLALGRETAGSGDSPSDIQAIKQAFLKSAPEHLSELRSAVSDCSQLLADIVSIWNEKAVENEGLNFSDTQKVLTRLLSTLDEYAPSGAGSGNESAHPEEVLSGNPAAPVSTGVISNRADVVRVLDKICDYYSVNEPSSPIPLLLRRAQRLVEKSFLEILEDMVPDGVQQARIVSGTTSGSE